MGTDRAGDSAKVGTTTSIRDMDRWNQAAVSGIAARGISLFSTLISVPLILDNLGNSAYGRLAFLTSIFTIVSSFDAGLGVRLVNDLSSTFSTHVDARNRILGRTIASSVVVVLAELIVVLVATFTALTAFAVDMSADIFHVIVAVVLGLCVGPFQVGFRCWNGVGKESQGYIWMAVNLALGTLCLVVIAEYNKEPLLLLASQAVVTAGSGIVSYLHFAHQTGTRLVRNFEPKGSVISEIKSTLRSSSPFAVLQLGVVLSLQIDTVTIYLVLDSGAAAEFSVAQKILLLPVALISLIVVPFWPRFRRHITFEIASAKSYLDKWTAWISSIGFLSALVVLVGGGIAVDLWSRSIRPSTALVAACAVWIFISAINAPQALALNALDESGFILRLVPIATAVNLGLSVLFTTWMGVSGPIWATSITHLTVVLLPTRFRILRTLGTKND